MYMFPATSEIYAMVPWRIWWAPWRWSLDVWQWAYDVHGIEDVQRIATKLTKAECIGLMKILGYEEDIY
jgi:hypothetical protein